ncbi:MAG TPA: sigma-70 family RNA polymerase sigma factor [Bryobacteraceae bacterium]|nr:sigma-70 family RNA polymerase sigma factor [Bryobacteraceae bacterium]
MTTETVLLSSSAEAALIRQIVQGRRDLFGELLRPHLPVLLRFVRSKMKNDPCSEDVVQQTALKAFIHLDQFQFRSSFRTWLFRIAINEVMSSRQKISRLVVQDDSGLAQLRVADQSPSPLKQCERQEMTRLVRGAVNKLAEKYRIVLRLRDLEHLTLCETAEVLHLSLPAVKTRHYRARRKIRRFLAPVVLSGDRRPRGGTAGTDRFRCQ